MNRLDDEDVEAVVTADALEAALNMGAAINKDVRLNQTSPVGALIALAKKEAALALAGLIDVDPEDHKEIRRLQNVVQRFLDMTHWVREALADARNALSTLSRQDRTEMERLLSETSTDQRLNDA
jgi:hypothetical protein